MPITIKEAAQRAGVSAISVARMLNGATYMHKDTRLRVEEAIRAFQDVPNALATSLHWTRLPWRCGLPTFSTRSGSR